MSNFNRIVLYLIPFSLFACCCTGPTSHKESSTNAFHFLRVTVKSPSACFDSVEIKNDWSGVASIGFLNTDGSQTIKRSKLFSIDADSTKRRCVDVLTQIKKRSPIRTNYGDDLAHFILTIDEKKYIDAYGQDSLLDKLLIQLIPYARIEEGRSCDVFNVLQQVKDSFPNLAN